jgi:glycosyltransferase involved in cell wall biosynthesis
MDANIYVHDAVVEIFSQYIDSSIFLLTSIYEPFGLVLPEAMSCGLPVVSFEADGPNSIITDGKDGIIVREREVEVFANRVCQLIEDKELRRQMGKNAIISAQRYSAEHIMPMWINLFESLKT